MKLKLSTKPLRIDTGGVAVFADLGYDPFGFILILEGALRTIDELFNGLLINVSSHLLHDADGECCDLLVEEVALPADQLQDAYHFLPGKFLHRFLAEHVLDEETSED